MSSDDMRARAEHEMKDGEIHGRSVLVAPFHTHHLTEHCILMWEGEPWLMWRHPDGQWVTEEKVAFLQREDEPGKPEDVEPVAEENPWKDAWHWVTNREPPFIIETSAGRSRLLPESMNTIARFTSERPEIWGERVIPADTSPQQEPVAWRWKFIDEWAAPIGDWCYGDDDPRPDYREHVLKDVESLYTSPPSGQIERIHEALVDKDHTGGSILDAMEAWAGDEPRPRLAEAIALWREDLLERLRAIAMERPVILAEEGESE